jgi:hypothetical protein
MRRYCTCLRFSAVITNSYHKVLYLLAACQKYDMASIQSSIRAKVKHGDFPAPKGAEAFSAYAIADVKGLIPEMENAARQTLNLPMTFEMLGEGLRLFDGQALRYLADFRKRCRKSFIRCLNSFLDHISPGPSSIWIGCPNREPFLGGDGHVIISALPGWLCRLLSLNQIALKRQNFTQPLDIHSRIRGEYITALQNHNLGKCYFCLGVHMKSGSIFCAELENKLAEGRDKVTCSVYFSSNTRFTSRRYTVIASLRNQCGFLPAPEIQATRSSRQR